MVFLFQLSDLFLFLEFSVINTPEISYSHLKNDGWKMILSFWDCLFLGAMFNLRGVIPILEK